MKAIPCDSPHVPKSWLSGRDRWRCAFAVAQDSARYPDAITLRGYDVATTPWIWEYKAASEATTVVDPASEEEDTWVRFPARIEAATESMHRMMETMVQWSARDHYACDLC